MSRRARAVALSLTLAGLALPLTVAPASAAPAASAKPYDFDGDGYPELAVGVGNLRDRSRELGGAVVVLPGSRKGLSLKEQVLTEATPEVAGEFNVRRRVRERVRQRGLRRRRLRRPGRRPAGRGRHRGRRWVTVLFGSAKGLSGRDSVELVAPAARSGRFGAALATADFDADGWPDLAVGDPSGDRVTLEGQYLEASGR